MLYVPSPLQITECVNSGFGFSQRSSGQSNVAGEDTVITFVPQSAFVAVTIKSVPIGIPVITFVPTVPAFTVTVPLLTKLTEYVAVVPSQIVDGVPTLNCTGSTHVVGGQTGFVTVIASVTAPQSLVAVMLTVLIDAGTVTFVPLMVTPDGKFTVPFVLNVKLQAPPSLQSTSPCTLNNGCLQIGGVSQSGPTIYTVDVSLQTVFSIVSVTGPVRFVKLPADELTVIPG